MDRWRQLLPAGANCVANSYNLGDGYDSVTSGDRWPEGRSGRTKSQLMRAWHSRIAVTSHNILQARELWERAARI